MDTSIVPERFATHISIDPDSGCWIWIGTIDKLGYPRVSINRHSKSAQRIVYESIICPIPKGKILRRTCHDPNECRRVGRQCPHRRCVRPDHGVVTENIGRPRLSIKERIRRFVHIDPVTGCWMWSGPIDDKGYARLPIRDNRSPKARLAHRISYETFAGPIQKGLDLDHLCHTKTCAGGRNCMHRRCVNPEHLEPVTRKKNLQRGTNVGAAGRKSATRKQRAKTHFAHGHKYTAETLGLYQSATHKFRYCKTCLHLRNVSEERKRKRRKQPINSPSVGLSDSKISK